MPETVALEPAPIRLDSDRVFRIGDTRVTLDTLVAAFEEGCSAEGIAEQYPSLRLADIYAAIAYYLNHRDDVDAYLHRRRTDATSVRVENERRFDPVGIRARLLSRQEQ